MSQANNYKHFTGKKSFQKKARKRKVKVKRSHVNKYGAFSKAERAEGRSVNEKVQSGR